MKKRPTSYTYYLAGELFSLKHLTGNVLLSNAIQQESKGRFKAVLPQDLENCSTGTGVRDADLLALLNSDVALFHFDGTELDSGTIVEFMYAKFADIPSVVLRTDFRLGGDNQQTPWNLMVSGYPRTEQIIVNAMELWKSSPVRRTRAFELPTRFVARLVIKAFDSVILQPAILPIKMRKSTYEWLRLFPEMEIPTSVAKIRFRSILKRKISKGLL